jgi:2-oxoglutarate/2-oxoacid ferredoxin oxidoreductase subunit alpha
LDLTIRLAGESGEGVILAGEVLTYAISRMGLKIFTFRTYPTSIRGGPCAYQIRASDWHAYSQGDKIDFLVAFDAEAVSSHVKDLKADGKVIYDQERIAKDNPTLPKQSYGAPFTSPARDELRFPKSRNMIIVGFTAASIGIPEEIVRTVVSDKLGNRGNLILEKNISAIRLGFSLVPQPSTAVIQKGEPNKIILSGNQAIALGAIAAGCRFYGGYPITPASDILELMAELLPTVGGHLLQGEDEMASLGAAIGASFAGTKAMTATSGPGFSLMTEMIGMASMAEIPVVIVDAQRGGPSTGLPTKTEQSDLNQALFAGHGDVPRMVIAPGDVQDCFYQTVRAFNLAERYQLPVILLTDQSLAQCTEGVPLPDMDKIEIVGREKPKLGETKFLRYAAGKDGLSPMSAPGELGGEYVAESAEHDERGRVNLTPKTHREMTAKRFAKLTKAENELADDPLNFLEIPDNESKLAVMGWGSTEGAIHDAVLTAKGKSIAVKWLHCKLLNPLPRKKISSFLEGVESVIVPELNYTAQFGNLLRMNFAIKPISITKTEGMPFAPREILQKIEEFA